MDRIRHSSAVAELPAYSNNGAAPGYFRDRDTGTGQRGTQITAAFLNGLQEEMVNVILAAGGTPDPENLGQVAAAVQQLIANAFTALGTPWAAGIAAAQAAAASAASAAAGAQGSADAALARLGGGDGNISDDFVAPNDLDNLIVPGRYYYNVSVNTHIPASAGIVEVMRENPDYVYQISQGGGRLYWRYQPTPGVWTDWAAALSGGQIVMAHVYDNVTVPAAPDALAFGATVRNGQASTTAEWVVEVYSNSGTSLTPAPLSGAWRVEGWLASSMALLSYLHP